MRSGFSHVDTGTLRNLPNPASETYTLRNPPEPSETFRNQPFGTFRNLPPKPTYTPEPSEIFQNLPELASGTYTILHRNSPEPSGTCLRNLHQHTPEPSGTLWNLPPEPTPAHARTLRNLPEPSSGTCSCDPHRHTPELIWAEDPISLRCWGKTSDVGVASRCLSSRDRLAELRERVLRVFLESLALQPEKNRRKLPRWETVDQVFAIEVGDVSHLTRSNQI